MTYFPSSLSVPSVGYILDYWQICLTGSNDIWSFPVTVHLQNPRFPRPETSWNVCRALQTGPLRFWGSKTRLSKSQAPEIVPKPPSCIEIEATSMRQLPNFASSWGDVVASVEADLNDMLWQSFASEMFAVKKSTSEEWLLYTILHQICGYSKFSELVLVLLICIPLSL